MQIVGPSAILLDIDNLKDGVALLKKIEYFGRVSHRSEDAQGEDSWHRFIQSVVLNHGDWSIVEHVSVSASIYTDRGVGEEQVRHRLFSYTKESTRFVSYAKKLGFNVIYPKTYRDDGSIDTNEEMDTDWIAAMEFAEMSYYKLIDKGWKPEHARSVIPLAFATKTIVTGNLRSWRHFFIMRTTKETHPQMREIMIPLLGQFQQKIPLLFDDIKPMMKQRENLRLPR